jgi:hypothetical protein
MADTILSPTPIACSTTHALTFLECFMPDDEHRAKRTSDNEDDANGQRKRPRTKLLSREVGKNPDKMVVEVYTADKVLQIEGDVLFLRTRKSKDLGPPLGEEAFENQTNREKFQKLTTYPHWRKLLFKFNPRTINTSDVKVEHKVKESINKKIKSKKNAKNLEVLMETGTAALVFLGNDGKFYRFHHLENVREYLLKQSQGNPRFFEAFYGTVPDIVTNEKKKDELEDEEMDQNETDNNDKGEESGTEDEEDELEDE